MMGEVGYADYPQYDMSCPQQLEPSGLFVDYMRCTQLGEALNLTSEAMTILV